MQLLRAARILGRSASKRARQFALQGGARGVSNASLNNSVNTSVLLEAQDLEQVVNGRGSGGTGRQPPSPARSTAHMPPVPRDWILPQGEPPAVTPPPSIDIEELAAAQQAQKAERVDETQGLHRLHNDLASLLSNSEYDTSSNYFVGAQHEYVSQAVLSTQGFALTRQGGAHDQGVDLRGGWVLTDRTMPVIVQCKRQSKPVETRVLREIEGALGQEPADTIAVVVAGPAGFSSYARAHVNRTDYPFILVGIDDSALPQTESEASALETTDLLGRLQMFVMNARAQALTDVVVAAKYHHDHIEDASNPGVRTHVLLQHGTPLGPTPAAEGTSGDGSV